MNRREGVLRMGPQEPEQVEKQAEAGGRVRAACVAPRARWRVLGSLEGETPHPRARRCHGAHVDSRDED